MTRAKERGSVVGFVAVGVLLTALLVGSIYGAKHYFVDAKTGVEEVATTAGDKAKESKDSAEKKPQDESAKDKQQSEAAEKKAAEERAAKEAAAEKKARQQQQSQEAERQAREDKASQAAEDEDTSRADDSGDEPLPVTGVDRLPQTGPLEDTVVSMLAISTLAGAVVAYRRSQML